MNFVNRVVKKTPGADLILTSSVACQESEGKAPIEETVAEPTSERSQVWGGGGCGRRALVGGRACVLVGIVDNLTTRKNLDFTISQLNPVLCNFEEYVKIRDGRTE